jgi:hypothetical protein
LIRFGYGDEDSILRKPLHILLERLKWFFEEERKEKQNNQFQCPLMNTKGSKGKKKKLK